MRLATSPLRNADIAALKPGQRITDPRCVGLGVRLKNRAGAKPEWTLRYTSPVNGKVREMSLAACENTTIGKILPLAREQRGLIQRGVDPLAEREAIRKAEQARVTLEEFRATYARVVKKKPSTVRSDDALWDLHVLPRMGKRFVDEIAPADVQRLHDALSAKTPTRANRAIALISHALTVAARRGLRPQGPLPRGSVERNPETKRETYLTPDQMKTLTDTLVAMQEGPHRDAATVLLILMQTGARKGEIKDLAWSEVDLAGARIVLPAERSKRGPRIVALSPGVVAILEQRQAERRSAFVFPSEDGKRPRPEIEVCWRKARIQAGIPDFRIHDLRHSYAAAAVAAGLPLTVIGKLLGHTAAATTARYAHVADAVQAEGAAAVAAHLGAILTPATKPPATPVKLRRVK